MGITPDFEDGVIFAHSGDVGTLKRGTRVTFTVVETAKGRKAKTVSVEDSDDAASEATTCSTAATAVPCPSRKVSATAVPCPSRRVLPSDRQIPGPDDRRRMRR